MALSAQLRQAFKKDNPSGRPRSLAVPPPPPGNGRSSQLTADSSGLEDWDVLASSQTRAPQLKAATSLPSSRTSSLIEQQPPPPQARAPSAGPYWGSPPPPPPPTSTPPRGSSLQNMAASPSSMVTPPAATTGPAAAAAATGGGDVELAQLQQSLKERLALFYSRYNSQKSSADIDAIMVSFLYEEIKLMDGLIQKYGNDGSFTDLYPMFEDHYRRHPRPASPLAGSTPGGKPPLPQQSGRENTGAGAAAGGPSQPPPYPPPHQDTNILSQSEELGTSTDGATSPGGKRRKSAHFQSAGQSDQEAEISTDQVPTQQASASSSAQPRQRGRRATSLFHDMNPHLQDSYWSLYETLKKCLSFNPLVSIDGGSSPALGADAPVGDLDNMTMGEFVTAVTEFQHSAQSFVQQAKHIVDYSRQRQTLEEASAKAKLEQSITSQRPEGEGIDNRGVQLNNTSTAPDEVEAGVAQPRAPSPTNYMVTARGAHYHRYDLEDKKLNAAAKLLEQEQMMKDGDAQTRVVSTARSERVVIDVVPMTDRSNVVADILKHKAKPGDVLVLHPGIYKENIVLGESADIEIRPSSDRDDSSVTIYPANPSIPIIQLDADASLRISGVSLQEPQRNPREIEEWTKRQNKKKLHGQILGAVNTMDVPLISVSQASKCDLRAVSLLGGTGAILVFGSGNVALTQCTIRKSAFAGVYCKDSAFASASNCHFIQCEVALRVRDGTFSIQHCEMRSCSSDAVALHGTCKGVVERCTISDSGDNGIILSPSCEVLLQASVVERSAMWGVYAPNGADFALVNMGFDSNGMGDSSRAPPFQSAVTRFGQGQQ